MNDAIDLGRDAQQSTPCLLRANRQIKVQMNPLLSLRPLEAVLWIEIPGLTVLERVGLDSSKVPH